MAGAGQHPREKGALVLVRDRGRTLRLDRYEAAGMIEVVVTVDDVPERFVRDEALDIGDHGQGAVVVERAFRDDHVIHHLDHGAVIGAPVRYQTSSATFWAVTRA